MIHLYCISYRLEEFTRLSLKSILDTASEELCITVMDNNSDNSEAICSFLKEMVDEGKIKRFISYKNNPMIWSFREAYLSYPPDNSEDFFIFTELDLIIPEDLDWIKRTREMQKNAVLTGFGLRMDNYLPPNGNHIDDDKSFGFWLMGLNRRVFDDVTKRFPKINTKPLSDFIVRGLMTSQKGTTAKGPNCLYHLGWDLWFKDHEYFKAKMKGIPWAIAPKPVINYVYEKGN